MSGMILCMRLGNESRLSLAGRIHKIILVILTQYQKRHHSEEASYIHYHRPVKMLF